MALLKLALPPEKGGYTITDGEQVLSTQLDGPAAAYRQEVPIAPVRITARWMLNGIEHDYLRAFYGLTGAVGIPFLIDLVVDGVQLAECQAKFVPGSFGLPQQSGDAFWIEAELDVLPPRRTDAEAQAIVDGYAP